MAICERRIAAGDVDHRLQRLGHQPVGVMRRPVGRHQRNRVADALDEAGQRQAWLLLGWHADAGARWLNRVSIERRITG